MRAWLAETFGVLALASIFGACRPLPTRPVVSDVVIETDGELDPDPILERLATAESPDLFGVVPRVLEYEIYDPTVLARDLERIERAYRARGYYEAKVTAARVIYTDAHHVRVEVRVHEGEPVRVAELTPIGLGSVPFSAFAATNRAVLGVGLRRGDVFDEARFEEGEIEIERALRSNGFAFAKVEGKARVDIARHAAEVTYTVVPGPRARYGRIDIVGLREIPEGPVRDVLDIREGGLYSATELEDAEEALNRLGVFSRVEIREDRSRPESRTVPLRLVVTEAKLRVLRLGGGTRLDNLRLSFHARAGWEDRNFLGGMRHFGVEARPGVTLFPTSIRNLEAPIAYLPEFRLKTFLRQPSFFEARTTGFIEAQYGAFPVLYPLNEDQVPENEPVLGYHEVKASTGIERAFPGRAPPITRSHEILLVPSYNWQANFPFYYREPPEEDNLEPVRVSFPEIFSVFKAEILKNRLDITISNSVQIAGFVFQGTVSDVKLQPDVRAYIHRVFGRGTTLALRATFGFLFPANYGDTLEPGYLDTADPTAADVVRDQQILLLRAFYSGGPTSNRGYPFRGVGPHGPIGFLFPSSTNAVDCRVDFTNDACIRPLGGLTLWEGSLEARFPLSGPVGGVAFVDASDLQRIYTIRFDSPHLSPGVGLRYETPVGPLRLDLAYRVPYLQEVGEETSVDPESGELTGSPSGEADQNFLNEYWLPLYLHFAIGDAF